MSSYVARDAWVSMMKPVPIWMIPSSGPASRSRAVAFVLCSRDIRGDMRPARRIALIVALGERRMVPGRAIPHARSAASVATRSGSALRCTTSAPSAAKPAPMLAGAPDQVSRRRVSPGNAIAIRARGKRGTDAEFAGGVDNMRCENEGLHLVLAPTSTETEIKRPSRSRATTSPFWGRVDKAFHVKVVCVRDRTARFGMVVGHGFASAGITAVRPPSRSAGSFPSNAPGSAKPLPTGQDARARPPSHKARQKTGGSRP